VTARYAAERRARGDCTMARRTGVAGGGDEAAAGEGIGEPLGGFDVRAVGRLVVVGLEGVDFGLELS
jgi:hypothetical protein